MRTTSSQIVMYTIKLKITKIKLPPTETMQADSSVCRGNYQTLWGIDGNTLLLGWSLSLSSNVNKIALNMYRQVNVKILREQKDPLCDPLF